jgi:DNA-binding GntR family transcriptional regulator
MVKRRKGSAATQSTSIRQKAYTCIQRKIATGELAAGSAISELDLAKELGSSRTPIREAISQLVAEGLLEQNPSGGVFVTQLTRESIIDLYELREALEMYAVGKVARLGLLRPAEKEQLQKLIDAVQDLKNELLKSGEGRLNAEQMNRFIAADFSFHSLLIGLSQNVRIHKVVIETRLLMRIFSMYLKGHDIPALDRICHQHQELLDAIERHDGPATAKIISDHIMVSQRERLEEFDLRKREASIRKSIPAFLEMYQPLTSL